jgi:hypothetical protein
VEGKYFRSGYGKRNNSRRAAWNFEPENNL